MQDGPVEAGQLGELRVGVQGVPVAGEPVQERLLLADVPLLDPVGRPLGHVGLDGGPAVAAEPALSPYEDLRVARPQRPVGVRDFGAQHDHGGLALVVEGGDLGGGGGAALDGDGPVQLDGLAAVQNVGEVDLDPGGGEAAHHRHAGAGDGREAGEYVESGLQRVAQLVRVGGRDACAEAEVVELDVLVVPGEVPLAGICGEGPGGIDRH
ncbi:hypothetical protein VR46_04990 [Streptomyces sp. NRRL S-444]|nr:hypothetical protein VR46_04990 [Streptomyces sp. NRRL S-444]